MTMILFFVLCLIAATIIVLVVVVPKPDPKDGVKKLTKVGARHV